jgi:FAD/FMN-containing dehydrogenase
MVGVGLWTIIVAAGAVAILAWLLAERRGKRSVVSAELLGAVGASERHRTNVDRIAAQLRARRATSPISLRKKAVSHQVPKSRDLKYRDEKIDVSDLTEILEIDPAAATCVAESGVSFVDLVRATLKHGLVPIVVPELKTITVGGAVSGCSLESMSFRYGGFHDTCLEYEVISADGEVRICTPEDDGLLFQMLHGSFGTLGILTRLKFRLTPAKPFVKVAYEKYSTLPEYQAAIRRHFEAVDIDFMDGIIHSPTCYVLSAGRFVDSAPYTHSYDWMRIYYQSTAERTEDYLETPDYFFRYDRGVTNVHPKSWLGRLFFGKFLDSSNVLRLVQILPWLARRSDRTFTLDVFVPFSRVAPFFEWYEKEFDYFPMWCVPYKRVRDYEWIAESFFDGLEDDLLLDLAIYGMERSDKNYHAVMEAKLIELGGIKTLISQNYYSEGDFWRVFNKKNYQAVKARMDPKNVFRDLYTKTCRTARGLADEPVPAVERVPTVE